MGLISVQPEINQDFSFVFNVLRISRLIIFDKTFRKSSDMFGTTSQIVGVRNVHTY
jgi:hypothetical protein